MRPYIDFNTLKRTISNNEADKKNLKLINNQYMQNYGKFKKEQK